MKRTRNGRFFVAIALAVGVTAGAVATSATALSMSSSSQSFTLNVSDSHTSVLSTSGTFSDQDFSTLLFGQFNISGATLTSVEIFVDTSTPNLAASVNGNCFECDANAHNQSAFSVTVDAPIGGSSDFTLSAPTPSNLALTASGSCDFSMCTPGDSKLLDSQTLNPALGSFDIVITAPLQLNSFIGAGNISVVPDLILSGAYAINNLADNVTTDNSTTVSASTGWMGTVKVTYNFLTPSTGVPEPASLALIGAALIAFAASRTRCRRS